MRLTRRSSSSIYCGGYALVDDLLGDDDLGVGRKTWCAFGSEMAWMGWSVLEIRIVNACHLTTSSG